MKTDDVQCRESPSASISCDFRKGSDVVLQKEKKKKRKDKVRASGGLSLSKM